MSIFTRVNRRSLTPYMFIAPAMIVMAIVTIYPLIF
ncbi:MAG: sugar ABC transporter permease, partial [Chloroflexi bacterium]|nr:sugar ABC transporter permease [Chloroflexota bacterium]